MVITVSLSPEMAQQLRQVVKEEDRTVSELPREAIRLYIEEREWRRLQRYGRLRTSEQGIAPEDVERLVDEHRDEMLGQRSIERGFSVCSYAGVFRSILVPSCSLPGPARAS